MILPVTVQPVQEKPVADILSPVQPVGQHVSSHVIQHVLPQHVIKDILAGIAAVQHVMETPVGCPAVVHARPLSNAILIVPLKIGHFFRGVNPTFVRLLMLSVFVST